LGLVVITTMAATSMVSAQTMVEDAATFRAAFADAAPGDVIELQPGLYELDGNLTTPRAGQPEAPITVRGPEEGEALLRFSREGGYVEGFKVQHAWWVFEGLTLEGRCEDHSRCEHAWHISGDADGLIIRNNIARDFNAHIKANRAEVNGASVFPDDVVIEGNEFYNTTVRQTSNPVTPIDVVGGRRWIIRHNFIHDHAKGQGNNISYAAFLKGNSKDGVFDGNLVVCELLHSGQIRLGLSFGGGGSGPDSICEDSTCSPEHENGLMMNNIIVNCPTDVGVFVRECDGCRVVHNTLYNTTGIDFIENSTGRADYNLLMGRIRDRQGSSSETLGNLDELSAQDFGAWFRDPAASDFSLSDRGAPLLDAADAIEGVTRGFCGQDREARRDIGAVEYITDAPCDTARPIQVPGAEPEPEPEPEPDTGRDAGTDAEADAGTSDIGGEEDLSADSAVDADDSAAPTANGDEESAGCACGLAAPPGTIRSLLQALLRR
jgi:hypothetical protein